MYRIALLASLVTFLGVPAPADAAQQLTATRRIRVVNPAGNRKIIYKVVSAVNTLGGDPTVSGASMNVRLTSGGLQCFSLPAQNWDGVGTRFKYVEHTPTLTVRAVLLQSGNGVFRLLFKAIGSAITVVPGNPTNTYDVNFNVVGGDNYCSGSGTAVPAPNNGMVFRVINDTVPGSCQLPVCSPSGAFLDASSDTLF
jgi:hypothetical protein